MWSKRTNKKRLEIVLEHLDKEKDEQFERTEHVDESYMSGYRHGMVNAISALKAILDDWKGDD